MDEANQLRVEELRKEIQKRHRQLGLRSETGRSRYYVLEGEDIRVTDCAEWAIWLEVHALDRWVAQTWIRESIRVSTVFLGLDHNFLGEGPPLLFETLVFGGKEDQLMMRYSTYQEALQGHWKIVEDIQLLESDEALVEYLLQGRVS